MACEPEDTRITSDPDAKLTFSDDSVIFDTLLTFRTSITKRFRIYNPNKRAVVIDRIGLGRQNSEYSIIVNGEESNEVENIEIFGEDSLMVLVNVSVDYQDENLPYLVKDSVEVSWGNYQANVKLVAWGQDANFLYGDTIKTNTTWTSDRPYVIYGYALVDSLATLTIDAGTSIYVDNSSYLLVAGQLQVQGDSGNHVTFSNTRFDENYQEAPGQWGGILFLEGSKKNRIEYADIQNGTFGLRIGNPDDDDEYDLAVYNTTIRHMSQAGILAFTSDVYAENTLIYNVGTYMVGGFAGGNYTFEHCTFVNSPSFFVSDDPSVQFADNLVLTETETLVEELSVSLTNSIIWGSNEEEILLSNGGGTELDTSFINNVIRSNTTWPGNFISQERDYPGFYDPSSFDFSLDSLSFARDKAIPGAIQVDITGKLRDSKPDIGAYERFDKE